MDLDPLDLALLIGMAQRQKKRCVRANEYHSHVLYPSGTQKERLFSRRSYLADARKRLREEARKMLPITYPAGPKVHFCSDTVAAECVVKMLAASYKSHV
ncbi:hypothetical protein Hypma_005184 [Hypsizygus marmoreus]|uniref:Uncharacterized protein n=1 Tax=Hypsizygus marmoreus TaxID=39966 RepID=A0A369J8E5_HYPMA|nr:hypothetical protein Hypma_005184 [Hypsizygus marmoreus]